jgi:GntR family transcriptional regulator
MSDVSRPTRGASPDSTLVGSEDETKSELQEMFWGPALDLDADPVRYRYDVVADHLAQMIESGQLPPDTALPSERDLAYVYEVSLGTARHATRLLRERGLVVTVRSKGTYVARKPVQDR